MNRHTGSQWTPEIRKERERETIRRHNKARYRAYSALQAAHKKEYERLKAQHLDEINAKLGPLPGDD